MSGIEHVGVDLGRDERETTLTRCDSDDAWVIYTSSPVMARKLAKLAESWGFTLTKCGDKGITLELPLRAISFRNRSQLSDSERARRVERLRSMREERADDDE